MDFWVGPYNTFTYDTEANALLKSVHAESDCDYYQYTLDYIFFNENYLTASNSSYCEVLSPSVSDVDLSDHLPVACTIDIGMDVGGNADIQSKESEQQDGVTSQEAETTSVTTPAPA